MQMDGINRDVDRDHPAYQFGPNKVRYATVNTVYAILTTLTPLVFRLKCFFLIIMTTGDLMSICHRGDIQWK